MKSPNSSAFEERDRQFKAIAERLDKYQRRYPELDVAYEYRIWVLETRAKADVAGILDYEVLFLRRLEKRRRDAQSGGRLDIAAALSDWPALVSGFKRLVHGFGQERYISMDTIRVYGEAFGDCSEEQFGRICERALRELDRFPSLAALRRIREAIRSEASQERDRERLRRESAEHAAALRRAEELDAAIEALGPEERDQLDREAERQFGSFRLPLPQLVKQALLRKIYEEKCSAHGQ